MTYTFWKGLLALVILCAGAIGSSAQQISIGFIGDQGTFGDHNNAAFEWASSTFNVKLIAPDNLANEDLTKYAVLWWQEGDADPTSLFTDDVGKALNDYVEKGGALLLSSAAESWLRYWESSPGFPAYTARALIAKLLASEYARTPWIIRSGKGSTLKQAWKSS